MKTKSWLRMILILPFFSFACKSSGTETDYLKSPFRLVFTESSSRVLYSIDPDGTNMRPLGDNLEVYAPECSPDKRTIALIGYLNNYQERWLWLYRPAVNNLKNVSLLRTSNQFVLDDFAWSHDGARIAFTKPGTKPRSADIWVTDTAGTTPIQLTQSGFNSRIRWSADDRIISFQDFTDSVGATFMMNADGSEKRIALFLPPGLLFDLQWSPHGNLIAFYGKFDSSIFLQPAVDLYVTDSQGQNVKRITFDGMSYTPQWSPDGGMLAFVSGVDGNRNIFTILPDGSKRKQLTHHGKVQLGDFRWSPDGKLIAYAHSNDPSGVYELGVVTADGRGDVDIGASLVFSYFDWLLK